VFLWGDLKGECNLEDIGVDGRAFLKEILKKWNHRTWTKLIWLMIKTGGGLL
jgi:hypothetical protein